MSYDNPWKYKGKDFHEEDIKTNVSFVYLITNKLNKRKYIGKKTFYNTNRVKQSNRVLRKKVVKYSDWQKYYGSSKTLLADIKEFGKENFERKILHLCKKRSHASYYEAKEQFKSKCLENDSYYNEWIYCKIAKVNIKGL
jgi:hypothetical protein